MAWIKPYRYWEIMTNPKECVAYQLEDGGVVYKRYYDNNEEVSVEDMEKFKAYYYYGVFDPVKNNIPYVDAGVPLAWCVAKRRGLNLLRHQYDIDIARDYKNCKE